MNRIINVLIFNLLVLGCKNVDPVIYDPLGGYSFSDMYLYTDGVLSDAHENVIECSAETTSLTIQVVSYGIDGAEIIDGEDFSLVKGRPSVPPSQEDIYKAESGKYTQYLQELTVELKSNETGKDRKVVLFLQSSTVAMFYASEITILQKGK